MDYTSFLPNINPFLLIALLIWSLFWKTIALWRTVKYEQKIWFIGILIINTFGVAEILYLFIFAKKKMSLDDFKNSNYLP